MTTSTTSKCCSNTNVAVIVTGVFVVTGLAALAVAWCTRRRPLPIDPLEEADRRIDELENTLRRLQDTFGQVVR
jgi:HAMP domain-containing protein